MASGDPHLEPTLVESAVAAPEAVRSVLASVIQVTDIPHERRIFCNRNLRMDEIDLIGFDMDYTLALYNQRKIEQLSVECTLDKLVKKRGYPESILHLDYDPSFAIRGLMVDRRNGNLFKMDRYGHVDVVYHGRRRLDREERHRLYRLERIRLSSSRYAWIDTLFALPEAVMFGQIVDHLESGGEKALRYTKLWQDIRDCIDEAHRDESMKRVIKANLDEYLVRDPALASTLHRFRSSGKRLFLLTNSMRDYTEHVMSWLLDGRLAPYATWRSFFDCIVVGASKPSFFTEKKPFLEVDAQGNPRPATGPFVRGRIYQGGNVFEFGERIGVSGDRVLYIGDHIYGDMLRAKKASVWRTALVIQELEDELRCAARMAAELSKIDDLELRRIRLDSEVTYQQLVAKSLQRIEAGRPPATGSSVDEATIEAARVEARDKLEKVRNALREATTELSRLEREVELRFNPFWGALFRVGVENSRFGQQVEDYACVYTSRVSNFASYSPLRYFRSPRAHMAHEL